jgi:hypothetical protein
LWQEAEVAQHVTHREGRWSRGRCPLRHSPADEPAACCAECSTVHATILYTLLSATSALRPPDLNPRQQPDGSEVAEAAMGAPKAEQASFLARCNNSIRCFDTSDTQFRCKRCLELAVWIPQRHSWEKLHFVWPRRPACILQSGLLRYCNCATVTGLLCMFIALSSPVAIAGWPGQRSQAQGPSDSAACA